MVWLSLEEIVKVALLSHKTNDGIDSNKAIFDHLKIDSEDYDPDTSIIPQ